MENELDQLYHDWACAVLSENKAIAIHHYNSIRHLMERYCVEPALFKTKPNSRKQFFQFNVLTGRIE